MKLTQKLFFYPWQGRGNNCNTYLYAGQKTILIDPGHLQNETGIRCFDMLQESMRADGFSVDDIDLILCTHSHPDHCEAATAVKEQKEVNVAMHSEEESHMQVLSQLFERMTGKRPPLPSIDIFLDEGTLELGTETLDTIQVLTTPGHSPGSLSFFFPDEKALVTGDAVFQGSIGRTDFPGGSLQTLGNSVSKLAALDGVELLLPGHMQVVKGQQSVQKNFEMIRRMFF